MDRKSIRTAEGKKYALLLALLILLAAAVTAAGGNSGTQRVLPRESLQLTAWWGSLYPGLMGDALRPVGGTGTELPEKHPISIQIKWKSVSLLKGWEEANDTDERKEIQR